MPTPTDQTNHSLKVRKNQGDNDEVDKEEPLVSVSGTDISFRLRCLQRNFLSSPLFTTKFPFVSVVYT